MGSKFQWKVPYTFFSVPWDSSMLNSSIFKHSFDLNLRQISIIISIRINQTNQNVYQRLGSTLQNADSLYELPTKPPWASCKVSYYLHDRFMVLIASPWGARSHKAVRSFDNCCHTKEVSRCALTISAVSCVTSQWQWVYNCISKLLLCNFGYAPSRCQLFKIENDGCI